MTAAQQLSIELRDPSLWIVIFNNPPINLIDVQTIRELSGLLKKMEQNEEPKVVVFRSADPEYLLAHWDVLADREEVARLPKGATGIHPWVDVLIRLSKAPVVSIADIRGGALEVNACLPAICGSPVKNAAFWPSEVGLGAVPGGDPMARLADLMGRGRTLEVILGANDFPERYGYINRVCRTLKLSSS